MKRLGNFVYYPLEVLSIANGGEWMIATTSLLYYMRDGALIWFAEESGPPGATAPWICLRPRLERLKILSRSRLKIRPPMTHGLGSGDRQRSVLGAQTEEIVGRRFSHDQVYRQPPDGC
jgi:hypothetical protein